MKSQLTHNRNEVLLEASDLEVGESKAGLLCPSCRGGGSNEHSFGITRERYGVLYNCHRNSCSFSGFLPTAGWVAGTKTVRVTKQRTYSKDTQELGPYELEYLCNRFELTEEDIQRAGWRYGIEDGRIIMPVRNRLGYDIGCTARSYDPNTDLKSIAYPDGTQSPWLGYYLHEPSTEWCVVVEDQVSALKLGKLVSSVALLGTGVNDDKMMDISLSFSNVFLWLDADARSTAFKLLEKYKLVFRNFIVYCGSNKLDPKDTSLVNLKEILSKYKIVV